MIKKLVAILIVLFAITSSIAYAHSGRTDKNGCHKDRKSGARHCH